MATVDNDHRVVVFHVAVIGGVAQRFIELLNLKDGELEFGEVGGYRPRFVFRVFPDDASIAAIAEFVPYVDALVLTDDFSAGAHYSSTALERLAALLSPLKLRIPSGIFGGPALAQEWQSLCGIPPVHVTDPRDDSALPVVKQLAKALLRSNLRSTPPPPKVQ